MSLTIEGADFTLDGQRIEGVRLLNIQVNKILLTINNLTMTGGNLPTNSEDGGGIFNNGTITLTNSTIHNNSAFRGAGIFNRSNANLTIINSFVISNSAQYIGGGIYSQSGTLNIINSEISENIAIFAGGIDINVNGILNLTDSKVMSNSASSVGAGIYNFVGNVTIDSSIIANNKSQNGGGGFLNVDGSALISNSHIISNTSFTDSGGIFNSGRMTIRNSSVTSNSAGNEGGGINNFNAETLTIINSTLNKNSSALSGGAIYNGMDAVLTIENSTLFDNFSSQDGGGIFNYYDATVTISNSTISKNVSDRKGGGIFNDENWSNPSMMNISSSTFSENYASEGGGGIFNDGTLAINNSIVANSIEGGDCEGNGTVNYGGFNIIEVNYCRLLAISEDPLLGPLKDNGGSTFTHALLHDSPAINSGDTSLTTDQRGILRPQGFADDIGAFEAFQYALIINKEGISTGSVTSTPAGIDCGNTCSSDFVADTVITLTANAATNADFVGWSGADCNGTGNCVLNMNTAHTVTATFNMIQHTLTINKEGTSTGSVVSTPAGIDCGNTCTSDFVAGNVITLTANPDISAVFVGWHGAGCSGTGNCVLTMNAAKTVTATFDMIQYPLSISKEGAGTGSVVSTPAGIDCGNTCTNDFAANTIITLTAMADTNSLFTGWAGGGCTGTSNCVVTMDTAKLVTATFKTDYTLYLPFIINTSTSTQAE